MYEAFAFIMDYFVKSFNYGSDSSEGISDRIKTVLYLFDLESWNAESEFEVFYVDPADSKERTYQYGFSLKGTEGVEEWFYTKVKIARNDYRTVFYRKKG